MCDREDLDRSFGFPKMNRERKPPQPDTADVWLTIDRVTAGSLANLLQSGFKLGKKGHPKPWLTLFIIGNGFKVFGLRFWMKLITHLNSALTFCRTSAAETG